MCALKLCAIVGSTLKTARGVSPHVVCTASYSFLYYYFTPYNTQMSEANTNLEHFKTNKENSRQWGSKTAADFTFTVTSKHASQLGGDISANLEAEQWFCVSMYIYLI